MVGETEAGEEEVNRIEDDGEETAVVEELASRVDALPMDVEVQNVKGGL